MGDFYSIAKTIEEARDIYNKIKNKYDWIEIVDMSTGNVLLNNADEEKLKKIMS